MKHYFDTVIDSTTGLPVSGATVTVYLTGTITKASLFSDNGVTHTANPITTDSAGRYAFYVADGRYDLAFSKIGFSGYVYTDVEIADILQANVGDQPVVVGDTTVNSLIIGNGPQLTTFAATIRFLGMLTTTAAASDDLAVAGMTSAGHAFWTPNNSAAAAMTGLTLVPGADKVTLNHPASAGAQFAIFGCFA